MIKNITIIGINYFPEDSAIGLYTTQKAEYFTKKGYKVTLITGFPYYPQWRILKEYKSKPFFFKETINGVSVLRFRQYVPSNPTFFKRVLHLLSFTFGSFINLFKTPKPDLVISIVPFTSSILLGWFLKLIYKSKLWVHVQDFEFDIAAQTGLGTKTSGVFKILFFIEKKLLSTANIISTISHRMLQNLKRKSKKDTYFLPNWIEKNQLNAVNSCHPFSQSDKIKILYSGNIGEKQDWNYFIMFCEALDPQNYEVIVVGDGANKNWLISKINKFSHVHYHPPVSYKELSCLLQSVDLHILFQKTTVVETNMPSKILAMMASGKPSLVIGNERSEVKQIFEKSNGGLFFKVYSEELITELGKLTQNTSKSKKMGENAREYVISNFIKDEILDGMIQKVERL